MEEQIARAREIGTAALAPSRRDLAYGLGLHAEAFVCESYGFSPYSAVDGSSVAAAIEQGASERELTDLVEDQMMTRHAHDSVQRQQYVDAWEAAGVDCIFQNAGEESQAPLRVMKRLARHTYATDLLRDFVCRAATPDDIAAAHEQGRRSIYLTSNGVPLPGNWDSREEELGYIRLFFQLGVRMMHLTYNRRNMLGDGCAEPANAGLSDLGRAAIAEMNRVGVIVDCAHSGWQTSLEAAQTSALPMVASHTVCAALQPHIRSKPDEVIRAIADTGGHVGIACIPAFLGGRGDVTAMLDHIDHAVRLVGAEHVAIGTDVGHSSRPSPGDGPMPPRVPQRPGWENFWPPQDPLYAAEWQREEQTLSMAWTNWPLFTVGLVARGYSDDDIRAILGGNVLRVVRAAWDGRSDARA